MRVLLSSSGAPARRQRSDARPSGSGFIGGRLIERLRLDGHEVRALARSDAAAARVQALGAEPVHGELADSAAMRAGAEGCELAFHAAATLGDFGRREDFERGNVT